MNSDSHIQFKGSKILKDVALIHLEKYFFPSTLATLGRVYIRSMGIDTDS